MSSPHWFFLSSTTGQQTANPVAVVLGALTRKQTYQEHTELCVNVYVKKEETVGCFKPTPYD